MLATTTREQTPLTKQLNTLTLWIAAAAGLTMVVMFVLGAQRGPSATVVFTSAVALAIAAIPEAMPTVLQVILSLGAADLAEHGAVLKDLASVETLGSTSAINSDKTGTLTMNQMTAVEVRRPDRPLHDLRLRLRAGGDRSTTPPAPRTRSTTRSCPTSSPATPSSSTARWWATRPRARCSCSRHKAGLDIDATRERYPRLATLPFDPTYKLMAAFTGRRRVGHDVVRCFVKGAAPGGDEPRRDRPVRGAQHPVGRGPARAGAGQRPSAWARTGCGSWRRGFRDLDAGVVRPRRRPAGLRRRTSRSPAWWGWSTRRAQSPSRRWPTPRRRTSACAWSPATT